MRLNFSILLFLFLASVITCEAQVRMKVKRKAVQPVNIKAKETNPVKFSLTQFSGKWQEISRKSRTNNSSIDFKDTLFFVFSGDDDVYIRDGINLSLQGKAEILPGNILNTGYDEFTIKSLDDTKAEFDDGNTYIHTLIKKKTFSYESFPTDSVTQETFAPIQIALSDVIGEWNVYRREAKPASISIAESLLKFLIVKNTDSVINGQVTFYNGEKTKTLACAVKIERTEIKINAENNSWIMDVYKADKKELIFGTPQLIYYCRKM